MAFLDCEKAFDRLNHEYLRKVLEHYGFGINFIKYIKMLISGFHALLTINGFQSNFFDVKCGSKQGDPISGLLFILCIEPLACAIRNKRKSDPVITLNNVKKFINLHADDAVLWSSSSKGLKFQLNIVKMYEEAFGALLNKSKSCIVSLIKIIQEALLIIYQLQTHPLDI